MDESFSVASASKFPAGEPGNEWTIEELLRWSLDQYHNKAIEQTSQNIDSLKRQCEKECEDVVTLHEMAVDMANKKSGGDNGGEASQEENFNPQSTEQGNDMQSDTKPSASAPAAAAAKPTSTTIEIQVTLGPHSSSKFLLRPKPGTPCLLGRSKGKKFIKNGVSLHKDQEVSTTHGKFIIEGGGLSNEGERDLNFIL